MDKGLDITTNGDKFVGEYKNGIAEGQGTFYFNDGVILVANI
jgi:hypothetical protein